MWLIALSDSPLIECITRIGRENYHSLVLNISSSLSLCKDMIFDCRYNFIA